MKDWGNVVVNAVMSSLLGDMTTSEGVLNKGYNLLATQTYGAALRIKYFKVELYF